MNDQTESTGGIKALFSELRRRHVFRTAAIYIAAAWVLLQVVALLFSMFDINELYQRYVAIALFAGFPVAVLLSWLFDLDLGQVTRTSPAQVSVPADAPSLPDTDSLIRTFPVRSVAVMPFVNVGGAEENEFFSDGIAEELINLLSKSSGLKVAARTSSFSFKHASDTVPSIASRLGVRHLLEGSVRRESSRVRISTQLIDALTGFQVWSSSFDRELTDIFAVQDEISSSIVYALSAAIDQTIGGTQSVRMEAPTHNMEAYQLYLRGMYLWQRRGETAIRGAIEALREAVSQDPGFVDAIELLAVTTAVLHEYSGSEREPDFDQAERYALSAMELAPKAYLSHAVLGYIAMRRWQWADSEAHFKRALSQDHRDPLVHQWYSNLLNDLGRRDSALVHALKAYQADQLSPQANNILAVNFAFLGENDSAMKHVAVAREFGLGGVVPDLIEYLVRIRQQRFDDAVQVMTQSCKRRKVGADWIAPTVSAIEHPSMGEQAVAALSQALDAHQLLPSLAFMQFALLRDAEHVYGLAEQHIKNHALNHAWLFLSEARVLREDPRFDALMDNLGLTDYWSQTERPAHLVSSLAEA